MKVYVDANVYVTYLLGQRGEELAHRFFGQGISCRFSIVASNTMFAEVAQRCGRSAIMLLQENIDDFEMAEKLEVHRVEKEETNEAVRLNEEAGRIFGLNDMEHALIARKFADAFVTEDRGLARYLRKTFGQNVFLLREFVESES